MHNGDQIILQVEESSQLHGALKIHDDISGDVVVANELPGK